MRKNRTCICCNEKYEYCPNCGNTRDHLKPTWYSEFCSESCKDLWQTATKYNMNMISKEEAKKIISGLKLKSQSEYAECVQRDLKNILEEPKVEPKAEPKFKAQKTDMK